MKKLGIDVFLNVHLVIFEQDPGLFVGRICSEAEEGRLTEANLILEGSAATSEGARVALDLSRVTSFRVFPGQVLLPTFCDAQLLRNVFTF